ncbi:WXG100 family type VII secretion target [Corynebacterium matruchotii]|uniref:WXG100 family type VII secretion target n=1 Tax=Corynebacterium matruchotii TaxID=43768 RepID=UPI0028E23A65|nr:WXG100 family type VII secretion target [Corynebacterium matruchotii]
MDIIKYGFGEIDAAAVDIQTTASRIGSLLNTLKTQIQPMVTAWEGSSSTAYQEAQAKWDHSADELNTILDTIARTVRNGNDDMSDVNRAATSSWG